MMSKGKYMRKIVRRFFYIVIMKVRSLIFSLDNPRKSEENKNKIWPLRFGD